MNVQRLSGSTTGWVTREDLARQLGIGINGVKQHVLKLKKEGLLERIGSNRAGSWRIKN